VRRVAGEQHSAVAILFQGQRIGLVDADPDRVPRPRFTHHFEEAVNPRQHVLGLDGVVGVLAILQLVVDAPDVARLFVHEHRRTRVARRVEVRQPLGRARTVELDIGDHVTAFVTRATFVLSRLDSDAQRPFCAIEAFQYEDDTSRRCFARLRANLVDKPLRGKRS